MKNVALIMNLGSPDRADISSVRKYLKQFLMDKYVLDFPVVFRWLLVNGVILRFRPKKTTEAYKAIWTNEGSPLLVISERVVEKLRSATSVPIYLAMRYGNPSIRDVLESIRDEHPDIVTLSIVPMYPHYAMSTTKTIIEELQNTICELGFHVQIKCKGPFYDDPKYIDALSDSIAPYISGKYEHYLFSYHGLPVRHLLKTDPTGQHCYSCDDCCNVPSEAHLYCYKHQVIKTTELVAERLNLPEDRFSVSFQSRVLKDPWITPFTDSEIERLAETGLKSIAVICPAFVSDNLETLEEIAIEGKETFVKAGGSVCDLIPCMNDNRLWIKALKSYVESM